MGTDYIIVRARDLIETLQESLPPIQFHAYVPRDASHYVTDLYLMGFIAKDVPLGGFCLTAAQVQDDFAHDVLNLAQFFRKAWQQEEPRFYPPELQQAYEHHLATGELWWRVA